MMKIPDKLTYKPTITSKLRQEMFTISSRVLGRDSLSYLEIGFDKGYTMIDLSQKFVSLTGIEINHESVKLAKANSEKFLSKGLSNSLAFIEGTSKNIPPSHYDVVLIDAAHDYENVKNDFQNVMGFNQAEKFLIFFHDFGLRDAGVSKFLQEKFPESYVKCGMEEGWNPLGSPIVDWEAAFIVVNKKI
jgi:hypothetical protein